MESSYLRLMARAASQHGVFTTSQAAELGVASSVLSRRVRNGSLARPYERVYVVAGTAATWERSVIVAVYSSSAQAVASHATACHLYELARRPRRIEVSVPGDSRPVRDHIIHRSTDLIRADVQLVKGIHPLGLWSTLEYRGESSLPLVAWMKVFAEALLPTLKLQPCFTEWVAKDGMGLDRFAWYW